MTLFGHIKLSDGMQTTMRGRLHIPHQLRPAPWLLSWHLT